MVRADIIDFIDKVLRIYCRNMREPFGGKQLLLVGDIYQLEPVLKKKTANYYPHSILPVSFLTQRAFREMQLVSIELTKVYRQSDPLFIGILDHIRTSQVGNADLEMLNKRVGADIDTSDDNHLSITLSTRRDTVDFINEKHLKQLPGDPTMFRGSITGEFPENSLPYSN